MGYEIICVLSYRLRLSVLCDERDCYPNTVFLYYNTGIIIETRALSWLHKGYCTYFVVSCIIIRPLIFVQVVLLLSSLVKMDTVYIST